MNGGFHIERCQKNAKEGEDGVSERLHFDWADGGIRATDAPGGTSLHPASRKTAASGQRNAGVGYGEGGTQTPRTGNNDCDVGTYRLGASDLSQTGGSYDGNDGFPYRKMPPKKRGGRKRRAYPGGCIFDFASGAIQATDAPGGTSLHPASRKTPGAVNGIQGLDTAKEAHKHHERGIMIAM